MFNGWGGGGVVSWKGLFFDDVPVSRSVCGLLVTHTGVILAPGDSGERFRDAARGKAGDWFYCCGAADEAQRQASVCVVIG